MSEKHGFTNQQILDRIEASLEAYVQRKLHEDGYPEELASDFSDYEEVPSEYESSDEEHDDDETVEQTLSNPETNDNV